jgi:hypothetical protein
MPTMDEYEYLDTANDTTRPVANLISWAYNETYPNTYSLFLDLIGWTEDNLGETIYDLSKHRPGYVELSYLAEALEAYSNRPNDIRDFVDGYEQAVMDHA